MIIKLLFVIFLILPSICFATEAEERLIIYIEQATYNKESKKATIKLSKAIQKAHDIQTYFGKNITLVYFGVDVDYDRCAVVSVPIKDVERNIQYSTNTVILTISNIPIDVANNIQDTKCFLLDTLILKIVSGPNFPPFKKLDPDDWYQSLNP